jgi:hypothetical protein
MKWIHPKLGEAAALAATIWIASAAGCRSQSGGMPSPFLAPDRVPPPATRTLMPGQAQPYYPGDPLPVMQSAAPQPAAATATSSPAASPQPTGSSGLAWSAPGASQPSGPVGSSTPPPQLARSNEPAVAVPTDGDSLRFPLPAAEPAPAPQSVAASQPVPQQATQLAALPQPHTVVPASYNAPLAESPSSIVPAAGVTAAPQPQSPWRSPQISQAAASPTFSAMPAVASVVPQLAPQPGTIDVRLRAVPSPPPAPIESTTPRIRLPGYGPPPPISGSSPVTQPAPLYATVAPASFTAAPQMVQITALPPSYGAVTNLAATPASSISPDGFRPRGSMR